MTGFTTNEEFFAALRALILAFCDRHALRPLSHILGPYLAFNGLTDSWGELHQGLRNLRAFCRDELSDAELEAIGALIAAADKALHPG
ncbi:MAG TPA: hypothetical protein VKQ73_01460 [Stellaceae bacterium]|nr:hypothetical protein [Stellaceae bacterium]